MRAFARSLLAAFTIAALTTLAPRAQEARPAGGPPPPDAPVLALDAPADAEPVLLVGPGSGGQLTQLLNGTTLASQGGGYPFGLGFGAGIRVAAGELTGDTTSDYVLAMGPGGGLVTLINGANVTPIASGYPFGAGFGGGVSVATGDVNGDGRADIIVGQSSGGGAVTVFSGTDISVLLSQAPFGAGFTGGVNVAAGDVDGDGRADVIVGQANGTLVSVISGATQTITLSGVPYGSGASGVFVGAGDVNGDGRAEIVAAPASGAAPIIVFDVRTSTVIATLTPFPTGPGGARVAVADLNGDGRAEVVAAAGPGAPPEIKVFTGPALTPGASRVVYDAGYRDGMFVAAVPMSGLRFTSAAATTFTVGTAGTFAITAAGAGPITLSTSGALPAGVTFVDDGGGAARLTGTPSAGTAGVYPLTLSATSGALSATQNFVLTVRQAPAITSNASATFVVGSSGSFTVTTTGSPTPSLSRSGALPSGVTFTDNGNGTATIAGTPATGTAATYPLTLTANNGVGAAAVQSFSLTVVPPVSFTSAAATTFTVGSPGSFQVVTTGGGTPAALTVTGALPAGVTFVDQGTGTGLLSGTPGAGTGGVRNLTFTARIGGTPVASQSFTLTTNQAPSVTSQNTAAFTVGLAQSFTITTSGHPAATVSLTGTLPSGLSFTNLGNGTAQIAGTAAPGSAGTYPLTVTATNGIGSPATQGLTLTVGLPPNAVDESFSNGVGNTQYSVGAGTPATPAVVVAGSVLNNDSGVAPLSAGPASITTTNGGQVAMAANGTFLYTPPVGFTGPSDTFTYVLTDGASSTDTAVVTINLSGVVWFVNSTGGGGDGRSHSPFSTMGAAATAAQANQVIYVHAGSPTGATSLKAGQALRGAGAAFALNGLSIPAAAAPTLQGTVTLANGVTVQGLSVNGGGGAAIAGNGLSGVETLTNVSIVGGSPGLDLSNISGTVTMTGGTISGISAAAAVRVIGGSGAITIGSPITAASGRSVLVSSRTGGTLTFSGLVTDTAQGIQITNNTGAAIAFTGGLAISTDTSTAFDVSGGGVVTATQNNTTIVNTLATTSGQALSVVNTNIGGAGLTFRSIAAGNSSYTSGNGITLSNTGVGSGDGGLAVVGNGLAGSGGVIRRKSGLDGVLTSGLAMFLESTKSASFRWMELSDLQNGAIVGRSVVGFSLQDSTIDGVVGTSAGEGALVFGVPNPSGLNGLTGAGVLNNVRVTGSSGNTSAFYNQSGSLNLQLIGTTRPTCYLSSNSSTTGGDGMVLLSQGTANVTVTVSTCQLRGNRLAGIRALAEDASAMTLTISEADIHRISGQGSEGVVLRNAGDAQLTATLTQNSFIGFPGAHVWMGQAPFNATAASLLRVSIINNGEFSQDPGAVSPPWVVALSSTVGQSARSRILIQNGVTGLVFASQSEALRVSTPDAGTAPDADIILIANHTDTAPGVFPHSVTIAATQPASRLCTKIEGNTFHWDGAVGDPGNGGMSLTQSSGATFLLERGASASNVPETVLDENNPTSATPITVSGVVTLASNGTCQAP